MASNFVIKIKEALIHFFEVVKNFMKKIINGILNFAKEVIGYFKTLRLVLGKHKPFIFKPDEQFKDMVRNAPVRKVGIPFEQDKSEVIIEGVLNEETNSLENIRYITADALDDETKRVLGNDELVVLN